MEAWIYTPEQLRTMPDIELRELIAVTPLDDDYKAKSLTFEQIDRSLFNSYGEKERKYRPYKDALEEFKRVSINRDGSKARMTPEIRACRERKEELYRLYKGEMERQKLLRADFILKKQALHDSASRYMHSMEHFVKHLLRKRATDRAFVQELEATRQVERAEAQRIQRIEEERIRRQDEFMERVNRARQNFLVQNNRRLLNIKENIKTLSHEELEAEMDDVCIICMDAHKIKDTLLTCCGHRFGKACFAMWHKQRTSMNRCTNCPMCKTERGLSITKFEERQIIDLIC
jgi:hypothetical protein